MLHRALLLVALAQPVVTGCRATPATILSDEAVVLQLPVVRQDELWECGLVSITALCAYYGLDLPPALGAELAEVARENEGLSGAELQAALEVLGLEVFLFRGTLATGPTALFGHVDRGRPPIVMTSQDGQRHHYCLILGYDLSRGHVVLLDPRRGRVVLPAEVFVTSWERSNRFTLLAVPREPLEPAPATGQTEVSKEQEGLPWTSHSS